MLSLSKHLNLRVYVLHRNCWHFKKKGGLYERHHSAREDRKQNILYKRPKSPACRQAGMLDLDLASLYGVKTFVLNQAVKRNIERFPDDFMFRLNKEESNILKSHFVMSSWGGRRTFPYAFTEQGIAMLSGILNSKKAIHVNIMIMRTFIRLKQMITTHKELAHKIEQLERKYKKHDVEIETIFGVIKKMLEPPKSPPRKFGFQP